MKDDKLAIAMEALRKIEAWELRPSGVFYPNADNTPSDRPAPYDSILAFGSAGGKNAIRAIARTAILAIVGEST